MKVLIFEWMIGGGRFADQTSPDAACPFQRQGASMASAVTKDLAQCGCETILTVDARLELQSDAKAIASQWVPVRSADDLWTRLASLVASVDKVLIIAPESGGCLVNTLHRFQHVCHKLIQPDIEFVRLAGNKHNLNSFLHTHGILTTNGFVWSDCPATNLQMLDSLFPHPTKHALLRIKPNDGAGGEGQWVTSFDTLKQLAQTQSAKSAPHSSRLGRPAIGPSVAPSPGDRVEIELKGLSPSVSVIGTGNGYEILPPTLQLFEGTASYITSSLDLPREISEKATALAEEVVSCLPPTRGFFGMDMIVGKEATLVEINPRLTTSYVVLRELVDHNLAALML